jgi:hypothetical protein
MPVATRDSNEQDRIARIEGMLETYMAQHAKLHEDSLALVNKVEQRSYELGERLTNERRDLTSALARIDGEIRAWRGVFVGLVAITAALIGALLSPLLADVLARGG